MREGLDPHRLATDGESDCAACRKVALGSIRENLTYIAAIGFQTISTVDTLPRSAHTFDYAR